MNKAKIKELVKNIQKVTCSKCCEEDYDNCRKCKMYIYTNQILEELNGS